MNLRFAALGLGLAAAVGAVWFFFFKKKAPIVGGAAHRDDPFALPSSELIFPVDATLAKIVTDAFGSTVTVTVASRSTDRVQAIVRLVMSPKGGGFRIGAEAWSDEQTVLMDPGDTRTVTFQHSDFSAGFGADWHYEVSVNGSITDHN